jgi:Undecaprenyl-phosphate glucose phosphotransferase
VGGVVGVNSNLALGRDRAEAFGPADNISLPRRKKAVPTLAEAAQPARLDTTALSQARIATAPVLSFATRIIDASAIVVVSVISGIAYHALALNIVGDISEFFGTGILVAALFTAIVHATASGQPLQRYQAVTRARDAGLAWTGAFLFFLFISFLLKFGTALSRGAILTFFFTGIVTVVVLGVSTPRLLALLHRSGSFARRTVILLGPHGDRTLERLSREVRSSICPNPVIVTFDAHCPDDAWATEQQTIVQKVFGLARSVERGEIFLVSEDIPEHRLESVVHGLAPVPRSLIIVPDEKTTSLLRHRILTVGNELVVEVQREPLSNIERFIKRGIDLLLSVILIVFLAPAFAAIAIGIKVTSHGPIFFSQGRLGYRGWSFKILKFRTMTTLEDGDSITQARKNDQRVTPLGRWLRKTSVDELPQLFNVLKGDMSLVGPRPHAVSHDKLYAELIEHYELRQHVKPGITGWAQVHGLRGETTTVDLMSRRIEFDLWYAKNASLFLDFQILGRTVFEVLRQRNAY